MTERNDTHRQQAKSPFVVVMRRIEADERLDPLIERIRPVTAALVSTRARREALHGTWVGHAIHPLLTDLPLGAWNATTMLDLFGGKEARPAAKKLLGLGLAASLPTVLTGLAEWNQTQRREQRVGVVHAASNTIATACYGLSYLARRRGRDGRATCLGVAGGLAAVAGGYLGGHLTEVRKVSTYNSAFDTSAQSESMTSEG